VVQNLTEISDLTDCSIAYSMRVQDLYNVTGVTCVLCTKTEQLFIFADGQRMCQLMMAACRQRTILTRVVMARLSLISVREGSHAYVSTRKLSCESVAEDTRGPHLL
jgi:hypothetical protein